VRDEVKDRFGKQRWIMEVETRSGWWMHPKVAMTLRAAEL